MLRLPYALFCLLVGNMILLSSAVGADGDALALPDRFEHLMVASKVAEPNDPIRGIELAREALVLAEEAGSLLHELQARSRLASAFVEPL